MKKLKKNIALSLLLMAGMVILAHAIIPHHHFNDGCLLNGCSTESHVHDGTHSDFKCLITNRLFVEKSPQFKIKKQQLVNLLLFTPEVENQNTFLFFSNEFIHTDIRCSNSPVYLLTESPLRAPPSARV